MGTIWEYISIRAKNALSIKQMMSLTMLSTGMFHFALLLFFFIYKIYPMAVINLCSVTLYVFCYLQIQKDKSLFLVFNLAYLEIILHSAIATFLLGTASGFSLYMIAMLPLGYYAAYNFNLRKQSINPMAYVIFSGVAFCSFRIAACYIQPSYFYGDSRVEDVIYVVNYFVAVIAFVAFFSTLLNQIKSLENLRSQQNKRLEQLSKTDALTGLANRRSIEECYAQSKALKEEYALIMGDIDNFKAVNDTYGHNVGDVVLKEVAEIFKNTVRDADTICRWGGEEFLVFLPKCTKSHAMQIAERILENICVTEMKADEGNVFRVTMTLGVAFSGEALEFLDVVKTADQRLYKGKQNGKNQVV